MSLALEALIAALLVVSGLFGLIGSYGLVRLRGAMQRLHAPTKASTVGLGAGLVASMLHGVMTGTGGSWQEVVVLVFIFVTAPITANYLSKTHIAAGEPVPPSGTDRPWATLDPTLDDDAPQVPRR